MAHSTTINHDQSEPNAFGAGFWTILFSVLLGVIMFAANVLYKSTIDTALTKAQDTPANKQLVKLRVYEAEQLNTLKWRNKSTGAVQIPIDMAMTAVVNEYR